MFHSRHIEQVIRSLLHEVGAEQEPLLICPRPTSPAVRYPMMSYDVRTCTVWFHAPSLELGYQRFSFLPTQAFLKAVFLHELGHHFHLKAEPQAAADVLAYDQQQGPSRYAPPRLRAEQAAWTFAEPLVPPRLRRAFADLRAFHLLGLTDPVRAERWLLERQMAHYLALPVRGASCLHKTALRHLVSWPADASLPTKEEAIHALWTVLSGSDPCVLMRLRHQQTYVALRSGSERRLIVHAAYDAPAVSFALHVPADAP